MATEFYVGLSAQRAILQRLETIASNVANQATPGFRAGEVSFREELLKTGDPGIAFAGSGENYISLKSGSTQRTGNPLDVAVSGDAWLAVQGPRGTAYTRDGRFQLGARGELLTVNGYPVLDASLAPIQLEAGGGAVAIAKDGRISQGDRQVGALGLFIFSPGTKLSRGDNSGVMPDRPAVPQLDFEKAGVVQGFVEGSNVNSMTEMTRLIQLQRTFESISGVMSSVEATRAEALRALAG